MDLVHIASPAAVDTVPTEEWTQEYEEFLGTSWEERQHRKQRIANGVAFLQKSQDAPLVKRMEFLQYKGLSQPEIEEAFEVAGQLHQLIRMMEETFVESDFGPTAEEVAHAKSLEINTPFRPGDAVWVYMELEGAYFPAVVSRIDESREHDILSIRYPPDAPHAKAGVEEWRAPEYKGVVADLPPNPQHLSRPSAQVLLTGQDGTMQDGIVKEVDSEAHCCDLESSTCELRKGVPWDEIRTIVHPKDTVGGVDETAGQPEEQSNLVVSAFGFPSYGGRERQAQARELLALMKGEANARKLSAAGDPMGLDKEEAEDDLTTEERHTFGAPLRSFLRYPFLDVPALLPGLQTYAAVTDPSSSFPAFDLSAFARHPRCPYLLEYNPILEIAHQCRTRSTMFVDPEFPPYESQLWGPDGAPKPSEDSEGEGEDAAPPEEYEWRRLSEILRNTRAFTTGSSLDRMRPGPFTPQWMCAVFATAFRSLELDTLFSPSQEPSYHGCYSVKLHIDGKFWWVVVDDFVPVYKNHATPACLRSSLEHELWPALLEKVYAKLQGYYKALGQPGPWSPEVVFEDLTGGMAQRDEYRLLTNKMAWFGNMQGRHENKAYCTMLLAAPAKSTVSVERKMNRLGIEVGGYHLFQDILVAVDEKGEEDESSNFVMTSDPWSIVDPEEAAQLTVLRACRQHTLRQLQSMAAAYTDSKSVACTWLPFAEHMRLFSACVSLYSFAGFQKALVMSSFAGRSGGSRFTHGNDRWGQNPQVYVSLTSPSTFCAELCLMDKRFRSNPVEGKVLQLSLLKAQGYGVAAVDTSNTVLTSNSLLFEDTSAIDFYSVYLQLSLEPGGYILVPEIGTYDSTEAFVLKIWSSADFTTFNLN